MNPSQSMMQTNWSNHQFPPTPPPSIPPTLPYLPPSKPLHLAHRRCHVHQHKCALQAHLLSLRPSHGCMKHLLRPHQEALAITMLPELMGLTSTLTGKKTGITTTTRRSRHSPGQFVSQLSLKSWISKGVILWLYRWRPWCINRPTTSGFENLPMDEKFTWSLRGRAQLLSLWRSFWRSSEAVGSTWTVSHIAKPDRMGNCWTKPTTPNMLLNKSQTSSTVGCQLAQLIQTPNMRSTSSGINWQNYANEQVKTLVTTLHHPGRVHRHLALRIHLSNGPSWTTQRAQHLHQHRHLILPACWSALPRSIHGWLNTCQPPWLCELSPNGSKNFHCLSQRGRFSLKTLPRPKKLGGHISLRKPLKLSNEWLSWWAYRLASWAKIMMCWTSCVLWQRLSVLPIFD